MLQLLNWALVIISAIYKMLGDKKSLDHLSCLVLGRVAFYQIVNNMLSKNEYYKLSQDVISNCCTPTHYLYINFKCRVGQLMASTFIHY